MKQQTPLAKRNSEYAWDMAQVTEKRPHGTAIVIVPPNDATDLEVRKVVDVQPASSKESLPPPCPKFRRPRLLLCSTG